MIFIRRPSDITPRYYINNVPIPICYEIKNLGVYISNDLSWNSHISQVTSAAYRLVRQLHRALPSPTIDVIKQLYTSIVRPRLEYAHSVIYPSVTALSQLEMVQRRCTKWGILKHIPYDQRLKILQLPTIEQRRLRGDNIQMFKYFTGEHKINWVNPISHPSQHTRQHALKFTAETLTQTSYGPRHKFLTNRIASHWSSLPSHIVDSLSTNQFKNEYDAHFHADLLPPKTRSSL